MDRGSAAARADLAVCRALLNDGSRSFHVASLLLPRRVCDPAMALYAFCRLADDAIDLGGGPGGPGAVLESLRLRLDRIWRGDPAPIPADRALARVVAHHAVPRPLLDALLKGLAWDAEGRRYETLEDLHAYAARVAGAVGAVMAVLMGARDAAAVARACDLGIAMQLSNIARDVGEDARAGRLYLPLRWLCAAGIAPEAWLARPVYGPALAGVVARLLRHADTLYAWADAGIACLPPSCRPGIAAARRLYAAIGHEVARPGFDPVMRRARVPGWRKLVLAAGCLLLGRPQAKADAPPLSAARFLVEAVAAGPRPPPRQTVWLPGPRQIEARLVWVIALLERMQQQEALRRGVMPAASD